MGVDLGYDGTSVVVTGGTRGIGKAVVRLLLGQGAHVLAVGSRQETADELRADIDDDRMVAVAQDMRADDCGTRLVGRAVEEFGGVDLVVNNAAAFDYVPADDVRREDWTSLFTLKALGYWSLARAAVPELAKRQGSVVNVSGVAGIIASPDSTHVGAVNAAVISMTESMAKAFATSGVRVNVVSPGATDTDRFATRTSLLAEREQTDESAARDRLSQAIPVGHPADPAEVALVIALLGSPVLRSVTGTHVVVDGGSTLGGRRHA
jgi:meso-butanediol dehydrogenase/(S,S)-butanediol dehydrogenase/diacetyl reductase